MRKKNAVYYAVVSAECGNLKRIKGAVSCTSLLISQLLCSLELMVVTTKFVNGFFFLAFRSVRMLGVFF